jgi:two-component system sensor kinase FixL
VLTLEEFLESLHADDREPVRAAVGRALRDGADYEAEYRVALPGGSVRWIAGRGKVERDRQGQPIRLRGVALDITDRKLAEEEAELHRTQAAHLARVTTFGEISGSLAHELNQPLAAILSNTRAAERHLQGAEPDLDELRAILADIRTDDLRASDMIQRIRAFLRRTELDRQPLDVAQLVEDAVRLVSGEAVARRSQVSTEVPAQLPPVAGDRVHLQQVLDAMSTCPPSGRRLAVRAGTIHPNLIEVAVSDTGVGIAPEHLARAFEPFYTTKQDGLGLGLAICRSIAKAHGGSIVLENNPDGGTTARVRLPMHA